MGEETSLGSVLLRPLIFFLSNTFMIMAIHRKRRVHTRQDILNFALQAFRQQGLRAVKMDDLAIELKISKRTLYEIFTDKEELILACLEHEEELFEKMYQEKEAIAKNKLELVLLVMEHQQNKYKQCNNLYFFDMVRFPKVKAFAERMQQNKIAEISGNMKIMVAEGMFRAELNYDLVAYALVNFYYQIFFSTTSIGVNITDFHENLCLTVLRGCATQEGLQQIDAFFAQ